MAGSGDILTYAELDARSNQGAHLFRSLGLREGDGITLLLENGFTYFEIAWAAQRSGLRYTCVSTHLAAAELAYIVHDSGAKLLIASRSLAALAQKIIVDNSGLLLYMIDGAQAPFCSFEAARAVMPITPLADETNGGDMLYSSGTTGKPKGVLAPLLPGPIDTPSTLVTLLQRLYDLDEDTCFFAPAPLYHAGPLRFCMTVQRFGGTTVVMEKFGAEQALAAIDRHKITHSLWVPTHFVRMLKLPHRTREQFSIASQKVAVHAAAPCPVPVKEAMIEWWGPVIHEFYSGTESNGFTAISTSEWLAHKGSVGRAVKGIVHVCDEQGESLPTGAEGQIYFENGGEFAYHNDPQKTADATNRYGWTTLGDIGRLDEDGYLYLTDRKSFLIISGGVNIYPQEIESLLITHPQVADAAVIGAPDEEMGEKVVAVVELLDRTQAGPALAQELRTWLASQISRIKVPRIIDFVDELPRHPTGKLYKRLIRDKYWASGPQS